MSRLAKVRQALPGRGVAAALAIACALGLAALVSGCSSPPDVDAGPARVSKTATPFVIVTTPAVSDLGLGSTLAKAFDDAYPEYDLETTVVASTDPAARVRAKGGDAILMVQAPSGARLIKDGYATKTTPVMSDRLVLIGPKDDPAAAAKAPNISAALARIAQAGQSASIPGGVPVTWAGTAGDPVAAALWAQAGIKPSGTWYSATATGTAAQLKAAAQSMSYALVEEAAFRGLGIGTAGLVVLRSAGMPVQRYSVVALSGAHDAAVSTAFSNWVSNGAGQDIIARWGITGSGGSLFTPAKAAAILWPTQ